MLLKVCLLLLEYYFALRCRIFFVSLVDTFVSMWAEFYTWDTFDIIGRLLAHFIAILGVLISKYDSIFN